MRTHPTNEAALFVPCMNTWSRWYLRCNQISPDIGHLIAILHSEVLGVTAEISAHLALTAKRCQEGGSVRQQAVEGDAKRAIRPAQDIFARPHQQQEIEKPGHSSEAARETPGSLD